MEIKTFKFIVCNASTHPCDTDLKQAWYHKAQEEIATPAQIDATINNFCKDHNVLSINANSVNEYYHNNARGNTVAMLYTIIYDDREDKLVKQLKKEHDA